MHECVRFSRYYLNDNILNFHSDSKQSDNIWSYFSYLSQKPGRILFQGLHKLTGIDCGMKGCNLLTNNQKTENRFLFPGDTPTLDKQLSQIDDILTYAKTVVEAFYDIHGFTTLHSIGQNVIVIIQSSPSLGDMEWRGTRDSNVICRCHHLRKGTTKFM